MTNTNPATHTITVEAYLAGAGNGRACFLPTHRGRSRISGYYLLGDGPWVITETGHYAVGGGHQITVWALPEADKIGQPVPWSQHEAEMAEWGWDEEGV